MNKVMGNKKTIALFVLPAFIIYAIFALAPIFYNVYLSLFDTDLMSKMNFVGIKNYLSLFSDKTFKHAFGNNILMVVGSLVAHMPLAMFFGNAIFKKIKGASFFQTVFFLPCVICGVAVGLTWTFIYNGNYGLLNGFLKAIGLGGLQQMWLANKETAMLCIIIVIMWQYVGYHMVIQLAAMRNIDSSFYEAAEIDGATGWQQFKYITFPLIKPILKIDAVLIITGSLKYYDLVAVMTSGGPNHATEVMSTYMYYQSFNILNYDTGALNALLRETGADPIQIYSKAGLWPFIIIFCNMWQQTGYGSVVYFAAICGIDSSMVEAAEVDGATSWQRIRYIILPSLKGTFIILLLFALGGIMKGNFGLFWNLTGGANSQLFPTTDIIETFVYRTMTTQNNFATSSAVGLYQSIFGFVLVMFSNWVVKRLDPDYALF